MSEARNLIVVSDGPAAMPQAARQVAVIICGSIQQAVLAIAPLKVIAQWHSEAELIVITDPAHARLFRASPRISRVEARWRPGNWRERLKARWTLASSPIDVVHDLTNTDETSALLKRFWPRKPYWSGTAEGCSHPHVDRGASELHLLDRHGEQLTLAGLGPAGGYPLGAAPVPDFDWFLPDIPKGAAAGQGVPGPFGLILPEPVQGIAAVQWPVPRYVELAHAMVRRGLRPVVAGTPAAIPLGAAIRAGAPEVVDLTARLDIPQFIALAREATLTVGGESDMTALAAAAGAPTVALINAAVRVVNKVAPRGPSVVTLVARRFHDIQVQEIMRVARSVQAPEVLQVRAG